MRDFAFPDLFRKRCSSSIDNFGWSNAETRAFFTTLIRIFVLPKESNLSIDSSTVIELFRYFLLSNEKNITYHVMYNYFPKFPNFIGHLLSLPALINSIKAMKIHLYIEIFIEKPLAIGLLPSPWWNGMKRTRMTKNTAPSRKRNPIVYSVLTYSTFLFSLFFLLFP